MIIKYLFSRRTPKQIYQLKKIEDQEFKALLQKDSVSAIQEIDEDYLPEPKRGDSKLPTIKETLEETNTFLLEKERFNKALDRLKVSDSISKMTLSQMSKDEFFKKKKISELDEILKEKLKNQERKKQLKKIQKDIEKDNVTPSEENAEQIPYFNKLNQLEKLEYLEDWRAKFNQMGEIDPYLLQRARTSQNIEQFLHHYLMDSQKYQESLHFTEAIKIDEILTNTSCTVVWVFWNFVDKQSDKITENYNKKLNKISFKISWHMCQELKLRSGPEIRFKISKRDEKLQELKQELEDNAEEILNEELIERYKAGELSQKISKKQYDQMLSKIKDKKDLLDDKTSEFDQLRRKRGADEKIIRKPTQSSKVSKNPAVDFWDKL